MVNSVSVTGRVTKDPVSFTKDGKEKAAFTVADNQYKTVNGERIKETVFFNCVASFGNQYIMDNLKSGMKITVVGKQKPYKKKLKNGQEVDDVFLDVQEYDFDKPKQDTPPSHYNPHDPQAPIYPQ